MLIKRSNPGARLAALMDGPPPVHLHADDLPSTATFSAWPGRGKYAGSVLNGVGVNSPLSTRAWGGGGYAGLKAAHLRPSTSQYVSFNAAAAAYGANTSFVWAFAGSMRSVAAQRNSLFLGHSANGNNWRGFYQPSGGQFGLLSNRNGAGAEVTNGSVGTVGQQAITAISFVGGTGEFLIQQLLADDVLEVVASGTHPVGGTLSVNRFTFGCALLNNAVSSPCAMIGRFIVCKPNITMDSDELLALQRHIRDEQGCPLPSTEPTTNVRYSLPSGNQRWAHSKLQTSALPAIDDWSPNAVAGSSSGVTIADQHFDFGGVATSWMTSGGYQVPGDNSPFTLLASVERVAGRSWDTSTNYNLVSDNNLRVTLLVSGGKIKYHYAGTLYDSGYDAYALWASGKRHSLALKYDSGALRLFVDDATTPVATHTGIPARTLPAAMNFGAFNLTTGSWQHKAIDFAIYSTALSSVEIERHWRVAAAQSYNLIVDGDSNIANVGQDFLAPVGDVGIWNQAKRRIFPRAGLKCTFLLNNGQSGKMMDTAGAFAPVSMIAGGASVDALLVAARRNNIVGATHTNDVHQVNYGGDTAPLLAKIEQWANERRASGKYRGGIGYMQAPPAENSTYNGRINTINAGLLTLKASGVLDFVVERHPDLNNPLDGIHWLPKVSSNDPEHYNGLGAYKMALQYRDAILNSVPFHD
jgi:hypothetical protein